MPDIPTASVTVQAQAYVGLGLRVARAGGTTRRKPGPSPGLGAEAASGPQPCLGRVKMYGLDLGLRVAVERNWSNGDPPECSSATAPPRTRALFPTNYRHDNKCV